MGQPTRRYPDLVAKLDGLFKGLNVEVSISDTMKKIKKAMRKLRQAKLADAFIVTKRRAAEPVPEVDAVLGACVQQMTLVASTNAA